MKYVSKANVIHQMSAENPPVLRINPGDQVCLETWDCYQGQLLSPETTFQDFDRSLGNPATGPIYVEGACVGDSLKIHVDKIRLDEVGIVDIGGNCGALRPFFVEEESRINRLTVRGNQILFDEHTRIPTRPMIGVIGTAPAEEKGEVGTLIPLEHGGNMDCTQIAEGCTLYLPVFVPGGLLAAGDLHAVMGEGEIGNCGLEIGGQVELTIDVVSGRQAFPWPVIETETHWITVACGRDLDEASQKAAEQMFRMLTEHFGMEKTRSGFLMDLVGDLKICQIVNPMKTVRMEFPKAYGNI